MSKTRSYRPRQDLDEEKRIKWAAYLALAVIVLFSSGLPQKVAGIIKLF